MRTGVAMIIANKIDFIKQKKNCKKNHKRWLYNDQGINSERG
jgi:hypothetical protein